MTATTTPTATPTVPQERRIVTAIPGPRSQALAARRAATVAGGVGSTLPVYAAAAGGGTILDVDGNVFADLGSGIAVTTVGASAPRVVQAVIDQVQSMTHTCFMVTPYEGYLEVCEKLAQLTPGDHEKRSVLVNSGSEAVENAVKIARRYTGRQAVVVLDHAYHGRTNLTMAMTAKNAPYKDGFGPFAPEVYRAPASYPLRDPAGMTGEQAARRAIDLIERQVGAQRVAAIVVEPIQGEGGFIVPADGFLPALVEWAHANGVVFVADEVQSGFARTGRWFASEHFGIVPDLVATAKGIGGGLPLAAVTGRAVIMDAIHAGGLGGTYGGNPIACAASVAAIETMADDDLCGAAVRIEAVIREELAAVEGRAAVGEVRGRGAMMALELVDPATGEPDKALTQAVAARCQEQGVLALTCGSYGNVLRLLPPLVIGEELLRDALGVLVAAVRELAA